MHLAVSFAVIGVQPDGLATHSLRFLVPRLADNISKAQDCSAVHRSKTKKKAQIRGGRVVGAESLTFVEAEDREPSIQKKAQDPMQPVFERLE